MMAEIPHLENRHFFLQRVVRFG